LSHSPSPQCRLWKTGMPQGVTMRLNEWPHRHKYLQVEHHCFDMFGTRNVSDFGFLGFGNICIYIMRYLGTGTQV
jgi:hypothetical protein